MGLSFWTLGLFFGQCKTGFESLVSVPILVLGWLKNACWIFVVNCFFGIVFGPNLRTASWLNL